ncbi:hypothetical protein DESC_920025 [Desulfosarcina cetonica]|uniref:hypothetical protein n=1 Tax=Desulfosarcina cetonica TaxID=90730 RepID=UPI0006D28C70|nr:hypothetical protein [Desulfosarcina cetonica]VTR71286.1 hypothetical protein DESC_920025 [Desulfosarcina cetonica]
MKTIPAGLLGQAGIGVIGSIKADQKAFIAKPCDVTPNRVLWRSTKDDTGLLIKGSFTNDAA